MPAMLAFRHVFLPRLHRLNSARSLLIAGAGDLGRRLALRRAALGDEVIALRRREATIGDGVSCLRADLVTGEGFSRLPRRPDALVFCAAPGERNELAYRALYVDGLRRLLDALQVPRIVFVSSTAVYAEDAGEWVDEDTLPRPPQFNGRVLLDAERELAGHAGGLVLRLSGIYGPGRNMMIDRAREGRAGRARWSNRIHVDDAAGALSHLLDLATPERLYLGNDDLPVLESELQDWLRQHDGLPSVAHDPTPETGRRVCNARLRGSGWVPGHADFRSGYGQLLSVSAL
jgi:electron-transferring-flavoprotein dehydrogenase